MNLLEILNTQVQAKIVSAEPSNYATVAKIGGRNIHFSVRRDDPKLNNWTMQFSERTAKGLKGFDDNFNPTGHGSELEVFSFVLQSLRGFAALYRPNEIKFLSSKKNETTPLYAKLAKKVSLPGYSLGGVSDLDKFDEFKIVKDK